MFSTTMRTPKNTSTSMMFTEPQVPEGKESSTSRTFAEDPFRARFGHRLPRGLRQEARGMDWRTFMNTYSPSHGQLGIQSFDVEKGRAGRSTYFAELITGRGTDSERVQSMELEAMGPVSATTNMLADAGYRVEIVEFHQFEIFEATATFIYAAFNNHSVWTMGFGQTPEDSIMTAMVCAANRLHS
ncbi:MULTISPECIES: acetyl-CoA acetyltransferase [unclassified Corynebacterium]|uniref:acetyl-CoA acetyltransferase n=1 Tax=unclassified Corynebacterium TaxID=2624378 RepID=UPI0030B55F87